MAMRVGFDLDGVLLPDFNEKHINNLNDYLKARVQYFKPLFDLTKIDEMVEVYLVTGRPGKDLEYTEKWVKEHFPGINLIHNEGEVDNAMQHKENAIIENNIEIFFESDKKQVEHLRENTDALIVWWEEFIVQSIKSLIIGYTLSKTLDGDEDE
jgi:acid phosphatase class B